ncbi:unnamed protein product, partial [marine sediment metagenome]
LMMGMSSKLAAMTGIDALGHAIEAYISQTLFFYQICMLRKQ